MTIKKERRGGKRAGAGRPRLDEPRASVSFRCSEDLKAKIDAAAKERGITAAAWVREVCIARLKEEE